MWTIENFSKWEKYDISNALPRISHTKRHIRRTQILRRKEKLHKPIPKGSMGRRIELRHVLNTNEYNNKISANFSFLSFQTCRNKVRLAPLKFRRIFLTQRHATVKVKLHIRGKTNSPRAKIQTCKLPLGQYAKFQWIPRPPCGLVMCTLVLFSDNLSRNRCIPFVGKRPPFHIPS